MSAIGPDLVGARLDPIEYRWTAHDAILYSLGIGAVHPRDLAFLHERCGPRVEPTFALAAITPLLPPFVRRLGIDLHCLLHAGQRLTVARPLGPEGAVSATRTIAAVHDKGSAALIECEDVVEDHDGVLASASSQWWVAGAGGFGAGRSGDGRAGDDRSGAEPLRPVPAQPTRPPARAPDAARSVQTTTEQAALYRLSGDLNPVHIDPAFAREAGQPRAILHGLCTMGALGHLLALHAPGRDLADLSARFVAPVFPGDRLDVAIWDTAPGEAVATVSVGGALVLGPAAATLR